MDLGFDADRILVTHYNYPQVSANFGRLRTALLSNPHVVGVSQVNSAPLQPLRGRVQREVLCLVSAPDRLVEAALQRVGPGYLKLFGHEVKAGRAFDDVRDFEVLPNQQMRGSQESVVLNEAAARALGLRPRDLPGERVRIGARERTVVGVVADFHYRSVQHPIGPVAIVPYGGGMIAIRVAGGSWSEDLVAVAIGGKDVVTVVRRVALTAHGLT